MPRKVMLAGLAMVAKIPPDPPHWRQGIALESECGQRARPLNPRKIGLFMSNFDSQRRQLLKASLMTGGLAATGNLLTVGAASAADKVNLNLQLGWLSSGNQIGEVVAKRLGYYEQEGLNVTIQPGGPNVDGVAVVASGRYETGQVSSSPSVMLAVSQGLPISCFAVGAQRHPYSYFSLEKKPVRKPADLVGKKVGIQPTAAVLLRALLAKNKIAEKDVNIIPIGADMTPLMTGQVDVVTGWLTNTTALKVLGKDRVEMTLWDAGVKLYALPYYANTKTLQTQPKVLEAFVRATARGWQLRAGQSRQGGGPAGQGISQPEAAKTNASRWTRC